MVVAFSGWKGVGKTTAANYLVGQCGFTKVSFSARLKELAGEMFPFTDYQLNGLGKEEMFGPYEWKPREFLEKLGEFLRFWDEDYLIRPVENALRKIKGNVVIDDLRYLNEMLMLRSHDAFLIRIGRYESENPFKHDLYSKSENELNEAGFDARVHEFQNKTVDDLYDAVHKIVNPFLK